MTIHSMPSSQLGDPALNDAELSPSGMLQISGSPITGPVYTALSRSLQWRKCRITEKILENLPIHTDPSSVSSAVQIVPIRRAGNHLMLVFNVQ
jgi:hypothetical protein